MDCRARIGAWVSEAKPAFVLAVEATKQACRVRDCLLEYEQQVELRIPSTDRGGYLEADLEGVRVVEFDEESFVEGPLGRTYKARLERRKKRWVENPGVSRSEQLIPFILAEANAVALGAATELGGRLVKWARLRRRAKVPKESMPLERLLLELAVTYEQVPHSERALILLRVIGRDVVFLAEPSLSPSARREAARLLLSGKRRGKSRGSRRPLRWDALENAWRPLPKNWGEEVQIERLLGEINASHHVAGDPPTANRA